MIAADCMPDRGYERPVTLARALELRALGAGILAGGTDYYPARVGRPLRDRNVPAILDLSGLDGLRGISEETSAYRLGALLTWTDIGEARLPPCFDGLRSAAREVGGRQIQNRATIGGNLCNASPAADGVPPLLSLGAEVELISGRGLRRLPLGDFILGPRKTALQMDEILSAILVPKPAQEAVAGFSKLGSRRYLVISLVMAAARIEHDGAKVTAAGVAIGACSPVARRLHGLERALIGQPFDEHLGRMVQPAHLEPLSPIDDPRASAGYRLGAALTVLQRLLSDLGSRR